MTLPTTEQIAQLTHTELVAPVTELIIAVQRLEAENQQLKGELAKARPRHHGTLRSRHHGM